MAQPVKQLMIRVSPAKHQRWKLAAVKRGVSLGKLIEAAVDAYLKRGSSHASHE